MNNTSKIPNNILESVKNSYVWNNDFDIIISELYRRHERTPDFSRYNYNRNHNYAETIQIDEYKLFDRPISEVIEYLKTLPQDYNLSKEYNYDGNYDIIAEKICIEPDEVYIGRLLEVCKYIDKNISKINQSLKKEKEQLEKRLKEINNLI